MDQPVLEGERIDERFQRRAGRTQRLGHVDLSGSTLVEIIRGGDARQDLAGLVIDREDRHRHVRAERARPLARQVLEVLLQGGVDGEPVNLPRRRRCDDLIGGVRRERRHWPPPRRHRLELGLRDLVGRQAPGRGDSVQHAVARLACGGERAIRPAAFGRLRQRHQQRCLAERQPPRLLAEISQRRSADAFEIAAVRRKAQIQRQHLVFAERALKLDRPHHLAQFRTERALGARLQQSRDLHGQGRAARHDAAAAHKLIGGAKERHRIDARMRAEAPVLVSEQQVDVALIDAFNGRRQPPAAFRRRVGTQQPALAIEHQRREREPFATRGWPERGNPPRAGERDHGNERTGDSRCGPQSPPHSRSVPSPTEPGLARVPHYLAQVGQARLAWGRVREGGGCELEFV